MDGDAIKEEQKEEIKYVTKDGPEKQTEEFNENDFIIIDGKPVSKYIENITIAEPQLNQSLESEQQSITNKINDPKSKSAICEAETVDQCNEGHLEVSTLPLSEEVSTATETVELQMPPMHVECLAQIAEQRSDFEKQLENLRAALQQKNDMIMLFQRENSILEKEKQAFRKEKELATKEKESIVIKFAMKEKLLIDAKKEKESVEKLLADAKKEIKNISTRFQAINEEKARITYMMDEKCNEVRKYQRECEKYKSECGHLESKLKYHINKLNMESEAKVGLEKKLEEERNAPNKFEEKANEKLKMEYEANTILLRHEIKSKSEIIENLTKENNKATDMIKQLQAQLSREIIEKDELANKLDLLQEEHIAVQNSYSEEMLNSAKLRGQLDELQLLRTQSTLNEEKIATLMINVAELEEKVQYNEQDLNVLHEKEQQLLSINKEISESIVGLQNEITLLTAKVQGLDAENQLLKREKLGYDSKYLSMKQELQANEQERDEERQLLTKHLSEKTKLYEVTKIKLENVVGDFEATKTKHATVVKELQREIQKYKKSMEQQQYSLTSANRALLCSKCQQNLNGVGLEKDLATTVKNTQYLRTNSRNSSESDHSSRRASETSESEKVASNTTTLQEQIQGPSKKHLVERILRLQQASARQTEKIDFLENHTLSLVTELQKKSKVVQYYMLRDEAGALTSAKSDQNKWELAKYGNGVMSAIYNGIKGDNKAMTLDLSLEINKKLQAVLEDTLLKNITLKENLDILGLEVDNLTRKLRQLEMKV